MLSHAAESQFVHASKPKQARKTRKLRKNWAVTVLPDGIARGVSANEQAWDRPLGQKQGRRKKSGQASFARGDRMFHRGDEGLSLDAADADRPVDEQLDWLRPEGPERASKRARAAASRRASLAAERLVAAATVQATAKPKPRKRDFDAELKAALADLGVTS